MDALESTLLRILEGRSYHVESDDDGQVSTDQNNEIDEVEGSMDQSSWCDYTLKEQVDELTLKGIESQVKDYRPICKKSVTYIVAAVVLNSSNEVLMMQEAKSACAGTWYLPAGRVEPGESLMAAVRREVEEETGLQFDPITLILLESSKGNWYRFVFTGSILGGSLKTASQADAESICADWIKDINSLNLRSKDILPLIDKARDYWSLQNSYHQPLLPSSSTSYSKLLLTLIVIIRKRENNQAHVLTSSKSVVSDTDGIGGDGGRRDGSSNSHHYSQSHHHLPTCEINPTRSLHATLKRFMQYMFNGASIPHRPHGLLDVEYSGRYPGHRDGMKLTLLVSIKIAMEETSPIDSFHWIQINPLIQSFLLQRLQRNLSLALNVV